MSQSNYQNRYESLKRYLKERQIVSLTESQFTCQGSKFVKHEGVIWIEEQVLQNILQMRLVEMDALFAAYVPTASLFKPRSVSPTTASIFGFSPWTTTAVQEPPPKWPSVSIAQVEAQEPRHARQRVPDTVSTLTAYRAWKVVNKHALKALAWDDYWPPREAFQATCNNCQEDVPGGHVGCPCKDCECGIWGFKSLDILMSKISDYEFDRNTICIGVCDLWGHYIEHQDGWRAEFAYPRELWFFDESLEPVAANYGVKFKVISLALVHQPKGGR